MKRMIVPAILVVLGAIAYLWWTNNGKEKVAEKAKDLSPKVQMAGLTVTDIDRETIKMVSKVSLVNRAPLDLTAQNVRYEVWVDSTKVMEESYPKTIHVRKGDSTTISLPVELQVEQLKELIKRNERENRDSAMYTIKTNFQAKVPVAGQREFSLEMSKKFPALREIEVKPGKVNIDKLGLKGSSMDMTVHLVNHNSYPIKISKGRFSVTVDKDLELQGTMEPLVNLPAKGSEDVTIQLDVETAKVPRLGWKMLFEKKQTHFDMRFTGKLISETEMLNNTTMSMKASGTLDELKQLAAKK